MLLLRRVHCQLALRDAAFFALLLPLHAVLLQPDDQVPCGLLLAQCNCCFGSELLQHDPCYVPAIAT
eukprot:6187823-Pleurochrysis_carterae.AAC.4